MDELNIKGTFEFDKKMSYIQECFEKNKFTDVKFVCGRREYALHSIILTLKSNYFKQLLNNCTTNEDKVILFPDINESIMEAFINKLYYDVTMKIEQQETQNTVDATKVLSSEQQPKNCKVETNYEDDHDDDEDYEFEEDYYDSNNDEDFQHSANEEDNDDEDITTCIFCKEEFKNFDFYLFHRKLDGECPSKPDIDPKTCHFCNKSMGSFEKLLSHEFRVHSFSSNSNLPIKSSKRSHSKKKSSRKRKSNEIKFDYEEEFDENTSPKKKSKNNQINSKSSAALGSVNCSDCDVSFDSMKFLKNHRQSGECPNDRTKNDKNPLECKFCGTVLKTLHLLLHHEHFSHMRSKMCDICGIIIYGRRIGHHTHFKKKQESKCQFCNQNFVSGDGLNSHMLAFGPNHNVENNHYECEDCDMIFNSLSQRKSHRKDNHRENTFHCDKCTSTFKSAHYLRHHIEKVHSENDKSAQEAKQCEFCEKAFSNKTSLQSHIHRYHIEGTYPCPTCPKIFNLRNDQRNHRRKCGEKKFKCPLCPLLWNTNAMLQHHLRIKHTEKHLRNFQCKLCEMFFTTSWHLARHYETQKHKNNLEKQT